VRAALDRLGSEGIVILHDFLSGSRCELMLEELEFAFWAPSTVVRQTRSGSFAVAVSPSRVSESTGEEWFSPDLRREIRRVETRLCRLFRLDSRHIEPWQATRYRRGGKFDLHFDGGPFRSEPAGDREVTLLVYLSTPSAGGSTLFPELGLDVKARAGTAVAWRNLLADGTVDPRMRHTARPLRRGSKVTLTTWSRQRPMRVVDTGRRKELR
jgi:hypothetical protein